MNLENQIQNLEEQIKNHIVSEASQWPVKSNRASEIGHPCIRYLYLLRTRWQEKALPDYELLLRFREGNVHEREVLKLLQESGIQVLEQSRGFYWKEVDTTGHIDAKIVLNNEALPVEVKSATSFSFASVNSVQDMLNHKWFYMRKYPAQMTMYLLMDEKEHGLFIFKDKGSGQLKFIPITLDYDYGEMLVQKAEKVNAYLKDDTPYDQVEIIDYDEDICGGCAFVHLCLPEVTRDALDFSDNPELVEKLTRREVLKPSYSEYQAIDKELKKAFKDQEKIIVGDWLVTGKLVERDGYTVAPSVYWQTKISKLGG